MNNTQRPPTPNPAIGAPGLVKRLWRMPLYSNAFYLMAGSGLGAGLGFIYWAVAARFWTVGDVGLMSAAIAAMGLLGNLANLSLGTGLIRFLPGSGEREKPMINFSLGIVLLTAVAMSVVFLWGTGTWTPKLAGFRHDFAMAAAFIIFTTGTAMAAIVDNVFVARRRAGFAMARGLIMSGLKLALIIAFAGMAASYGIFDSWGIGLMVSLLVGLFFFLPRLIKGYIPAPGLNWRGHGPLLKYSLINSLVSVFAGLPGQLLPIILLNRIDESASGYFYIAWQIAATLALVPVSISSSLFAEGCHDENELLANVWRSLVLAMGILAPLMIALLFFAGPVLGIFGAAYAAESTQLLRMLALALPAMAINQVYFSMLRVEHRLRELIMLNVVISAVTLGAAYLLLASRGTLGAGLGWLIGQTLVAVWITFGQGRWRKIVQKVLPWTRHAPSILAFLSVNRRVVQTKRLAGTTRGQSGAE